MTGLSRLVRKFINNAIHLLRGRQHLEILSHEKNLHTNSKFSSKVYLRIKNIKSIGEVV